MQKYLHEHFLYGGQNSLITDIEIVLSKKLTQWIEIEQRNSRELRLRSSHLMVWMWRNDFLWGLSRSFSFGHLIILSCIIWKISVFKVIAFAKYSRPKITYVIWSPLHKVIYLFLLLICYCPWAIRLLVIWNIHIYKSPDRSLIY